MRNCKICVWGSNGPITSLCFDFLLWFNVRSPWLADRGNCETAVDARVQGACLAGLPDGRGLGWAGPSPCWALSALATGRRVGSGSSWSPSFLCPPNASHVSGRACWEFASKGKYIQALPNKIPSPYRIVTCFLRYLLHAEDVWVPTSAARTPAASFVMEKWKQVKRPAEG